MSATEPPRRTVLVTGASRGIGRAVVARLRGHADVVAFGRPSALLEELRASGLEVVHGDLAAPESLSFDGIRDAVGRPIDGLVLAAGIAQHASVAHLTTAEVERHLRVNVLSSFALLSGFVGALRRDGRRGSAVAIASTLGLFGAPTTTAYAASKGALIAMCRSLALELAGEGIRVNVVAPGIIDTDMALASRPREHGRSDADTDADTARALAALHPIGRIGRPEEVADAVAYLLEAEFATGSVLTLDGGLTAG